MINSGEDAKQYAVIRRKFWLAETAVQFLLLILLCFLPAVRQWAFWVEAQFPQPAAQVAAYAAPLWLIWTILSLPLDWLRGYRLEHRFGLSNQSEKSWLADYLKGVFLSAAFGLIVVETMAGLLRWKLDSWWIWAAGAWLIWAVVLARILPTLLIPIFYKQTPLRGPLCERLEKLLDQCGTRVNGFFEINLSRTTKKANACLCGMGKSRRVLISDTLLAAYPPEEIETVLAHEVGHQKLGHIRLLTLLSTAVSAASFFLINLLLRRIMVWQSIPRLDHLAILPWLALGLAVADFILMPFLHGISRRFETAADRFALTQTNNPDAFISTMKRLGEQNLAEQQPPAWVEWLLYDHPSLARRIKMAENSKQ